MAVRGGGLLIPTCAFRDKAFDIWVCLMDTNDYVHHLGLYRRTAQVMFQGTAPALQRRGLGRLLTRCIMQTAVEAGHQVRVARRSSIAIVKLSRCAFLPSSQFPPAVQH